MNINIHEVLERIVTDIPAPEGDADAPLRALVFDSQYDPYKGVVVYMRLLDGKICPGMKVKMMATGAEFQVLECGYMLPLGLSPQQELCAGEVGYFTASIKRYPTLVSAIPLPVWKIRRRRRCPAIARHVRWYSAVFTPRTAPNIPICVTRLKNCSSMTQRCRLNRKARSHSASASAAASFGMLHMEIIQERLEREFDLDLVTTLPSVIYEVVKTDGTTQRCDNPHDYPSPDVIEEAREPYVKASIMTPQEFVGNIMPMCQDRRGIFKDMQYLDSIWSSCTTKCRPVRLFMTFRRAQGSYQGLCVARL